ncbi:DUF6318 family protein [Rothia dentocariosa]|uniref:DUF6318 family protein n=1 Tax=Rothia dentocariosa TaxID=2047 RepID=UPI0028D72C0E|nr:DUF6318 family protein [Rothia dentocariosa]
MNIPAHYLTRRSALGVIGGGSAAVALAACSTSNSSGGGGSDSSKRDDYSGEVKFDKFDTSAGNYEPATREHPAKNVPKPIKPDNLNDKSVEGFYQNIAFIIAGLQYLSMTADGSALKESNLKGKEQLPKLEEQVKSSGVPDKLWSEDSTIKASLDTPQPKIEGDTYTWEGKLSTDRGSFAVQDGQVTDIPEKSRHQEVLQTFKGTYKDGKWEIDLGTSSSASSGASGGASTGSGSGGGIGF